MALRGWGGAVRGGLGGGAVRGGPQGVGLRSY